MTNIVLTSIARAAGVEATSGSFCRAPHEGRRLGRVLRALGRALAAVPEAMAAAQARRPTSLGALFAGGDVPAPANDDRARPAPPRRRR